MGGVFDPVVSATRLGVSLLSGEHNRSLLIALAKRPMGQHELKAWLVIASATTLHRHLGRLLEAGVVHRQAGGGRVSYQLTAAGRGLLGVLALAGRWLERHPSRRLEPASPLGWRAFAALAAAWQLTAIQRLALRPHSTAELSGEIPGAAGARAERELARLDGAGIVRRIRGRGGRSRWALSPWGRLGVGVLAAAAAWERRQAPGIATPIRGDDAIGALLATLPLMRLPGDVAGTCTLTIEPGPGDPDPGPSSCWAALRSGRAVRLGAGPAPWAPVAWARGSIDDWLGVVLDGRTSGVQVGGDLDLAVWWRQLHEVLYGGGSAAAAP